MKPDSVAVLGAGNSGQCLAADCALAGWDVRLFELPEYAASLADLPEHKTVELTGPQVNSKNFTRSGSARLGLVTTDIARAVCDAEVICISVRATGYEHLLSVLAPHLQDGQTVVFYPDNYGALILRRIMHETGCTARVVVGGWSSLPYGARVTAREPVSEVFALYRAVGLRGDALPSSDAERFFSVMRRFPPMDTVDIIPADTMLDVGFSNVNPILHVPAVLLNMGAIDNWGVIFGSPEQCYDIYRHGFSKHVAEVQYRFYLEEKTIAQALGVGIEDFDREEFFTRMSILGREFMHKCFGTPLDECTPDEITMKFLPGDRFHVSNRYITEDIPVGCSIYKHLADLTQTPAPLIHGMITIASAALDRDFLAAGFTLPYLGLDAGTESMLEYLRNGV